MTDGGDLLLASAAQDYFIRIWRISARDPQRATTKQIIGQLSVEEDIKMKENTFTYTHQGIKISKHFSDEFMSFQITI